jgi:thioester reductase-like protein
VTIACLDASATITALAARIARVPEAEIDADTPFALLGIDSVGAIELAAAVEEAFGLELPPDVLADCRDVRSLTAEVDAMRSRRLGEPSADPFEQMYADAVLPADVVPGSHRSGAAARDLRSAQTILLTGVTGFLGRWIAKTLLKESQATLVCLVRSGRLQSRACGSRLTVVNGDLSLPQLGLSPAAFDDLANSVDAVCHAAAIVNWVLPYRALRATNVTGTLDLLRLAAPRSLPFHFVSSLSVCYSTTASAVANEQDDQLPHLGGLHLGYAQSKVVAEALVREAGRRGLPVTIYRPSFISGHSVTGAFNADDILARIVAGCVRMGLAPDLDWTLDSVPVDVTARRLLDLSDQRGTVHVRHPRPRHWRECVLWMRLYGYDVRLVPYHAWLAELEQETSPAGDPSHPLRPLRSFFLNRPAGARGQTLPELMLSSHRTERRPLDDDAYPPLDAALLHRYFDAFVANGTLPQVQRKPDTPRVFCSVRLERDQRQRTVDETWFRSALGSDVTQAVLTERLSNHSIISELTSWRSGLPTGLFRYRVTCASDPQPRDVVLKIKAADREPIAVGEALARVCDDRVGDAYARSAHRVGLLSSHLRELAIYEQKDSRFLAHAPTALATVADQERGTWTLILEHLSGAKLRDAVDRVEDWTDTDIDCAIRGLATLQSIWYGREQELRRTAWLGHVQSTSDAADMADLWMALATHAAPRFAAWADPAISSIQRRLIAAIDRWWRPLEDLPRTLIHNDFNPRNICLQATAARSRLIAYDWELATVGVPQHDLAELLCFVLPPHTTDRYLAFCIERHRTLLERECGTTIEARDWERGFRSALYDLMINRLPMYALVHRVRPQSFLPRVVRTWRRLYARFPLESA